MGRTSRFSPKQLGAVAAGGALLFTATALAADMCARSLHQLFLAGISHGLWILHLLLVVGIVSPGLVISQCAVGNLRKGVRLEWWRATAVDALRMQVELPVWTWISWAAIATMFASLIVPPHHLHSIAFVYFLTPINTLTSLKMALKKAGQQEQGLADWMQFKPMVSEHWGEKAGQGGASS